ncbi:MAG: LacI family DNA-binding transcriptional regulator [Clostridia bacterium]|nr:LacI family DNA-binding transcriptional regulator [Clostridia bacterium]
METYTIRDIARLSGVSVSTVSRVLNGRPDVGEETRKKVEDIISQVHFVRNASAISLKASLPGVVPVIFRGRQNPFYHRLSECLMSDPLSSALPLVTDVIDEEADEFKRAWDISREKHALAICLAGSGADDTDQILPGLSCPVLFLTTSTDGTSLQHLPSVSMDDEGDTCRAMHALLDMGHRNIAIFGKSDHPMDTMARRMNGIRTAYLERSLDPSRIFHVPCRFSPKDAFHAARQFFAQHPDVSLAFCLSDTMVLGVRRALHDLGISVPHQVSLIGMDGLEMDDYMIPSLTTIEQPLVQLSSHALTLLRRMVAGETCEGEHILVPGCMRWRESVSKPFCST